MCDAQRASVWGSDHGGLSSELQYAQVPKGSNPSRLRTGVLKPVAPRPGLTGQGLGLRPRGRTRVQTQVGGIDSKTPEGVLTGGCGVFRP